jgi:hypothetical protein
VRQPLDLLAQLALQLLKHRSVSPIKRSEGSQSFQPM